MSTVTKASKRRTSRTNSASGTTAQVVAAGEAYSLSEFGRRVGMGEWALRSLRRRGLKGRRIAGKAYVLGADWIRLLEQQDP